MSEQSNLVSAGSAIVRRNKRYIVWFFLMNLIFARLGTVTFETQAHHVLDHSLYADKLLHGFDLAAMVEMFSHNDFAPIGTSAAAAEVFAVLFFLGSLLLMPGVLLGYSSDHRISRGEFYRACGHNIWRFVRLFLLFAIIAGIIGGILMGITGALAKAADKTSNERLPFFTNMTGLAITFLALTVIRIWFDLAQTDVVLKDQRAVRKSVGWGFRTMRKNFGRLLGSYVVIAIVAAVVLVAGIVLWNVIVPPASVVGAFLVSQVMLFLLLTTRFWQRGAAVGFYVRHEAETVVETAPVVVAPSVSVA